MNHTFVKGEKNAVRIKQNFITLRYWTVLISQIQDELYNTMKGEKRGSLVLSNVFIPYSFLKNSLKIFSVHRPSFLTSTGPYVVQLIQESCWLTLNQGTYKFQKYHVFVDNSIMKINLTRNIIKFLQKNWKYSYIYVESENPY